MTEKTQNNTFELHIDIENLEQGLLDLLSAHCQLSKQKLKDCMSKGALWLGRGKSIKPIRRKNAKLKVGDQLHFYHNPNVLAEQVKPPQLVADEGDYSVWNKPYGVWSHGSKWGDHCSIGRLVEDYFNFQRQTFVVHRLDRAANGLIIVAHNKKAAAALAKLFASRQLSKIYRARVHGQFSNNSHLIDSPIDDKQALSRASLIEYQVDSQQSLLEVKIETGRKHQIRIHLSSIGFPIVGDRLYGQASEQDIDLQLTAYQISFVCPLSSKVRDYQLE